MRWILLLLFLIVAPIMSIAQVVPSFQTTWNLANYRNELRQKSSFYSSVHPAHRLLDAQGNSVNEPVTSVTLNGFVYQIDPDNGCVQTVEGNNVLRTVNGKTIGMRYAGPRPLTALKQNIFFLNCLGAATGLYVDTQSAVALNKGKPVIKAVCKNPQSNKRQLDRGHIVAHEIGGSNYDPLNVFPQFKESNQGGGRWFRMERAVGVIVRLPACFAQLQNPGLSIKITFGKCTGQTSTKQGSFTQPGGTYAVTFHTLACYTAATQLPDMYVRDLLAVYTPPSPPTTQWAALTIGTIWTNDETDFTTLTGAAPTVAKFVIGLENNGKTCYAYLPDDEPVYSLMADLRQQMIAKDYSDVDFTQADAQVASAGFLAPSAYKANQKQCSDFFGVSLRVSALSREIDGERFVIPSAFESTLGDLQMTNGDRLQMSLTGRQGEKRTTCAIVSLNENELAKQQKLKKSVKRMHTMETDFPTVFNSGSAIKLVWQTDDTDPLISKIKTEIATSLSDYLPLDQPPLNPDDFDILVDGLRLDPTKPYSYYALGNFSPDSCASFSIVIGWVAPPSDAETSFQVDACNMARQSFAVAACSIQ